MCRGIGYDRTAPRAAPDTEGALAAETSDAGVVLRWMPAQDGASGVAGYRIYLGGDPHGISDWFVQIPEVALPALGPDSLLRIQPLDYAGNTAEWITMGRVVTG